MWLVVVLLGCDVFVNPRRLLCRYLFIYMLVYIQGLVSVQRDMAGSGLTVQTSCVSHNRSYIMECTPSFPATKSDDSQSDQPDPSGRSPPPHPHPHPNPTPRIKIKVWQPHFKNCQRLQKPVCLNISSVSSAQ